MNQPPIIGMPRPTGITVQLPRVMPCELCDFAVTYTGSQDVFIGSDELQYTYETPDPPPGSGWLLVQWCVWTDPDGNAQSAYFWTRPKQAKP